MGPLPSEENTLRTITLTTQSIENSRKLKTIDDDEGDLHFLAHHVENGQWPWPSMLCWGQWVKSNLLEGTFAVNRPGLSI
ncbi:hypothetical protein PanWU01x14_053950 [Parasponia andersonii]|uniref:Uncharacterized protein n=1 Tax=Parasponia andersonii TaxID=3476 RepID=A0A2P5DKS2_PARAD|nr:hypothetical protein PanWU01x14_053950 [Parasponia andersonii]